MIIVAPTLDMRDMRDALVEKKKCGESGLFATLYYALYAMNVKGRGSFSHAHTYAFATHAHKKSKNVP